MSSRPADSACKTNHARAQCAISHGVAREPPAAAGLRIPSLVVTRLLGSLQGIKLRSADFVGVDVSARVH